MSDFLMPSLGADMDAGTLVEILKKPGDTVSRGEVIAAVETQKGVIEIEVFEDGVLQDWLVELGTKVPVGTPLARITKPGEAAEAPAAAAPAARPAAEPAPEPVPEAVSEPVPAVAPEPVPEPAAAVAPQPEPAPKAEPVPAAAPPLPAATPPRVAGERLRITPAARRAAARAGLDLANLSPGPDGIVALADIPAAGSAAPAKPAAPAAPADPVAAMREAIAAAMSRSKREIPHYYLSHTVDLTAAEAHLADTNADRDPADRILMGAVFVKAVARALKKYPEFNGHFEDGRFAQSAAIHTGMAVNLRGGGLVAPAIHDADTLALDDLMAAMRDLVARVRAGRFRARELSDATITVSSLGERGVESLLGVIYPPQVALVGFGTPAERAMVVDGAVVARRTVALTLAADHRVSDGHRGALFLAAIDKQLQKPEAL